MKWRFWQQCIFCHTSNWYQLPICHYCQQHLPWLSSCCPCCANPNHSATLCGQCIQSPPYFDHAHAVFHYQPPISDLIKQFKFQQKVNVAHWLAALFLMQPPPQPLPQLIIPVPLHPQRIRQRGFNQSLLLAHHYAKQLQIPTDHHTLIRHKATKAQSDLNAKQRRSNVARAFTIKKPITVKHVALVDDVMTTGNTLNAIAQLIKRHHDIRVDCWVIARAEQNMN